jgi:hypothetical protein
MSKINNLKFEEDFYLKVFLKKILFEIESYEVEDFLNEQFENTKDKDVFLKVIRSKVIPLAKEIIDNPGYSTFEKYHEEIVIYEDFVETREVVKNLTFELNYFKNLVFFSKHKEDIKYRIEIIYNFCKEEESSKEDKLTWIGKSSDLAYLIGEFCRKGYIEKPLRNGNINNTKLARQLLNSFNFKDEKPTNDGLRQYIIDTSSEFNRVDFNLREKGWEIPEN